MLTTLFRADMTSMSASIECVTTTDCRAANNCVGHKSCQLSLQISALITEKLWWLKDFSFMGMEPKEAWLA